MNPQLRHFQSRGPSSLKESLFSKGVGSVGIMISIPPLLCGIKKNESGAHDSGLKPSRKNRKKKSLISQLPVSSLN